MNRMYYVLLLIISLFMVISCAQQPINTTAAQVEGNTQIETDAFQKDTWVSGPKLGDMFEGEYSLRGNFSGGKISYYELLFLKSRDVKRGEAFYSKSFDKDGQELPVVVIKPKGLALRIYDRSDWSAIDQRGPHEGFQRGPDYSY